MVSWQASAVGTANHRLATANLDWLFCPQALWAFLLQPSCPHKHCECYKQQPLRFACGGWCADASALCHAVSCSGGCHSSTASLAVCSWRPVLCTFCPIAKRARSAWAP